MTLTPSGRRKPLPTRIPRSPIRWAPDDTTVLRVMDYTMSERRKVDPRDRRGLARQEILVRIYGNTRNPNHPAYSPEIGYETVARSLTQPLTFFAETAKMRAEKAGLIAALDAEWEILQRYFCEHFAEKPKPNPDN